MSRRRFFERHPYWSVALLELVMVVVYLAAAVAVVVWPQLGGFGMLAVAETVMALILAAILTRRRWWRLVGFRKASPRTLLLIAPMLLPALVNFYPGCLFPGWAEIAGYLLVALSVGFVEEVLFRGVMLRTVEPLGQVRAVVVTTVMFSLSHLLNVFGGGAWWQSAMQVGYTAAIGVAFAALALRGGALWPLIIVHGLIDFVAFLANPALVSDPAVEVPVNLAITAAFIVYGVWVFRRCSPKPDAQDVGAPAVSAAR